MFYCAQCDVSFSNIYLMHHSHVRFNGVSFVLSFANYIEMFSRHVISTLHRTQAETLDLTMVSLGFRHDGDVSLLTMDLGMLVFKIS